MDLKRGIVLTVIMADDYIFLPGDKVHISKRDGLFYVSCNHLDFGLAKEVHGNIIKNESELACEFDAVVISVDFRKQQLEVEADFHFYS